MNPQISQTSAYKQASTICRVMSSPAVHHILSFLERTRDVEVRHMVTSSYNDHTIRKYLRHMAKLRMVRMERVSTEVTYRLNHDRLNTIKAAATQLVA